MTTINKQTCPTCGQSVNERRIALFNEMVVALFKVYRWCQEKGIHEFERKEVKHLFSNENISARFGDWVFFGGLVYKHGKGNYGINLERCDDFFKGKLSIPTLAIKNPLSEDITYEQRKTINFRTLKVNHVKK